MHKFNLPLNGLVAPLDKSDVDTDAILAKQFLKSILRTGFGQNLFYAWRYLDQGEPGQTTFRHLPNPDFVLNQPRYQGASILLSRKNFGCGSSREHAPWALEQYGFRAIIASSFADIFYSNCTKNGLLPIALTEAQIDRLFNEVGRAPGYRLTIDLEQQVVMGSPGSPRYEFDIDTTRKSSLMHGLDDIDLTLRKVERIHVFEARHYALHPWLDKSAMGIFKEDTHENDQSRK